MLRTEIDWDRANLLQLIHCHRDALKEALAGNVHRQLSIESGHSMIGVSQVARPIRPNVTALLQEVCLEMDLDAEHAG